MALRQRGRLSTISFFLFWVIALSLIVPTAVLEPSPLVRSLVWGALVLIVTILIGYHLSIRSPVCRYRLGYQHALGVPKRCERCGTEVS